MKKAILTLALVVVLVSTIALSALAAANVSFTVDGISCSGGISYFNANNMNPFDSDWAEATTTAGSKVQAISATARLMSGSTEVKKATVTNYNTTKATAKASNYGTATTGGKGIHSVSNNGASSGDKNTDT